MKLVGCRVFRFMLWIEVGSLCWGRVVFDFVFEMVVFIWLVFCFRLWVMMF